MAHVIHFLFPSHFSNLTPILSATICDSVYRYVLPLCNHARAQVNKSPIYSLVTIVDLEGTNLDEWLRMVVHLQVLLPLAQLYPETYDKIFITNAPLAFPNAWNWLISVRWRLARLHGLLYEILILRTLIDSRIAVLEPKTQSRHPWERLSEFTPPAY